ncbi:MAG: hypothetical protein ACE5D2_07010 [Fidelibacterota bacterium]
MTDPKTSLENRIAAAQMIGNVGSFEYMVPYPNLGSLVEGQTIKYGEKLVFVDSGLTNNRVFQLVQQTANWLTAQKIHPGDRVLAETLPFPEAAILAHGVWSLGAILVITGDQDYNLATDLTTPVITVPEDVDLLREIRQQPAEFIPTYRPQLNQEALVLCNAGTGIRLSHYNLLVNTNGVMQALKLENELTFFVDLPPTSTAWVVLQLLLPFYSGAAITSQNPDLRIALPEQDPNTDFIVDFDWTSLEELNPPHLYVKPENTAFLALNRDPLHLTALKGGNKPDCIQGHSVMMGYLDDRLNERVYKDGWLKI